MECMSRKLDWDGFGLNINGATLNHLRFAYDIILFEEDPMHLEEMIKSLNIESMKVDLTVVLG